MRLRERSTTALYTFVDPCFRLREGRQLRASERQWQIMADQPQFELSRTSRPPHTVDITSWILNESAKSFELASGWQLCVKPCQCCMLVY